MKRLATIALGLVCCAAILACLTLIGTLTGHTVFGVESSSCCDSQDVQVLEQGVAKPTNPKCCGASVAGISNAKFNGLWLFAGDRKKSQADVSLYVDRGVPVVGVRNKPREYNVAMTVGTNGEGVIQIRDSFGTFHHLTGDDVAKLLKLLRADTNEVSYGEAAAKSFRQIGEIKHRIWGTDYE